MSKDDAAIEAEIQAKGLNAPRLTPAHIDSVIVRAEYHVFDSVLTVCVLTLKNGYKVTGESACASPENFNAELGAKIARDNARGKIWALEGYLLRSKLASARPIGDGQVKHMVDRFLGWRLPANFSPDAGISFKAEFNEHTACPMKHEPVGTNLFDATQAKAMIRYLIEGLEGA